MHLLMIFVDGFGLGSERDNPIVASATPNIDRLLGGHLLWGKGIAERESVKLRPVDATLGVEGIPQSATGQTTLWTGVNGAKALGYHLKAYPNKVLTDIINQHSIFKQLHVKGKRVAFANAFSNEYLQRIGEGKRKHSASTLCALAGSARLLGVKDLIAGSAVYHDLTNQRLQEAGEDVPLYKPSESGINLAGIAEAYDFTLFEIYLTDTKGHKRLWDESVEFIGRIDEMIGGLMSRLEESSTKMAVLLTSDHGNIEDFQTPGHTLNPVPALGWSNFTLDWPKWTKLEDITPGIMHLFEVYGGF